MANKNRLIDANALIATFEKIADEDETPFFYLDEITQEIFDAPTVDVWKWIPVTAKLPKPYTYVLVCGEIGGATLGYMMPNREWKGITHWMPLPEPPKGE